MFEALDTAHEASIKDGTAKKAHLHNSGKKENKPVTPAYNAKSTKPTATKEDYFLDPKLLNDPKALLNFALNVDHSDPGYLSAAFLIGYGYKEGRFGFEINEAEAEKWLKIARIDDKPYGDNHPATKCARAVRTILDPKSEAASLVVAETYLPAVFLNCISRQVLCLVMEKEENRTLQDEREITFKRLVTVTEKGFVPAITLLGQCYFEGYGVAENKEQALTLFRKAAELGDIPAINFINEHYKKEANKCCVM